MDWLEEIELYLQFRLFKQKGKLPDQVLWLRENLDGLNEILGELIVLAKDTVQELWEDIDEDGMVFAKLTPVSVSIGKKVMSVYGIDDEYDNDRFVLIGDTFMEGFMQLGYVDIVTPPKFSSTPLLLRTTDKWMETIELSPRRVVRGIYNEAPGELPLIQRVKFNDGLEYEIPTIKRWTRGKQEVFDTVVKHSAALRSATKLANTPWKINQRVLDIVSKTELSFENKSKQIEHSYTMKYAEILANEEKFYFATEFDYRGRLYFTMPFLNFQGADLAKNLLQFAEGKPVGTHGLRWMKIHAAASYNKSYSKGDIPQWCEADYKTHLDNEGLDDISVDKMTLNDRVNWIDNNWSLIEETAADGIIHDCEKPIAFLAICLDLVEAQKDPNFVSYLPIPVDGSNNGWQHLGAMSKDAKTGNLVGLIPVKIQQDFYVQTAKALIHLTKDERRKEILASMPMKHIRKGISKRGSMTRAYSAGAQKIAENMYQDCAKENFQHKYGITEDDCKGLARDLVKAIEKVCPGPLKTMKFLQQLAKYQLDNGAEELTWTTPSGFPVTYTCNHVNRIKVTSRIKGVNPDADDKVRHKISIHTDKPDARGFMCGISPNFVHSQDASHMHITIDRFSGLFGAVHDSFSTHAGEVDELLNVTKEVFIEMYTHPNYFNRIKDKLGGDAEAPALGKLNIGDINESDYFFA